MKDVDIHWSQSGELLAAQSTAQKESLSLGEL
jgi:hypothetical protein